MNRIHKIQAVIQESWINRFTKLVLSTSPLRALSCLHLESNRMKFVSRAIFLRLCLIFGVSLIALAQLTHAEDFIRLSSNGDRVFLIDSDGKPFFAHGVNHIAPHGQGEDAARVAPKCETLKFNAYGYGSPADLHSDMPYVESWNDLVPMSLHRNAKAFAYRDVFDQAVKDDIRQQIRATCEANRNNKNLIGYFWTDMPAWQLNNKHGFNWVDFCRRLAAGAAGKKAFLGFLQNTYRTFPAFNSIYKTESSTWQELASETAWENLRPNISSKDDLAFLRLIAREYYSLLGNTTRQFDPNHLILGDRLSPQGIIDEVVEEMLPYVDAISIQPLYRPDFPRQLFTDVAKKTGKPIVIADFAIRFRNGDQTVRGGKLTENADLAGSQYANVIRQAIDSRNVIAAFWCNWQDSVQKGKQGVKQGLFGPHTQSRPRLHEHLTKLNEYREEAESEWAQHQQLTSEKLQRHPASRSQAEPLSLKIKAKPSHSLSQDLYGANNECIFRPVWFDHPAYTARYKQIGNPFFRFPGGTGSNFYNPFTGFFDDDSPSTRDYSDHNARIDKFTDGAGRVPDQYLNWAKENDVSYSLVLNVCTQTFEQNKAWIEKLGREGRKAARIEIGNEVFYGGYKWAFPSATNYAERARKITGVIRKELPDTKVGVLVPTHLYQELSFLSKERPAATNHQFGWIKELAGKDFFDAVIMHVYSLTGMSNQTKPAGFIPYLDGYQRCDEYMMGRMDRTLANLDRLFPGKKIWMTEFGVGGFGGKLKQYKLRDSHLGALHAESMLIRFINHPSVTVAHWHSFQHFFDFLGGKQGIGEHPHLPYTHFTLFKDAIRQSDRVHSVTLDGANDDIDATALMKSSGGYLIVANRLGKTCSIEKPTIEFAQQNLAIHDIVQLTHLTDTPLTDAVRNLDRCAEQQWRPRLNEPIVLPPYSITRLKLKGSDDDENQ